MTKCKSKKEKKLIADKDMDVVPRMFDCEFNRKSREDFHKRIKEMFGGKPDDRDKNQSQDH